MVLLQALSLSALFVICLLKVLTSLALGSESASSFVTAGFIWFGSCSLRPVSRRPGPSRPVEDEEAGSGGAGG
jgi:hypothetical protein